jgi:hypothetical protein
MATFDYQEYLRSDHWQTMRRLALDHAEHRCQLCYSPNRLEVHHRTYERLGAERLADLTVLCDACHQAFHRIVRAKQSMQGVDLGTVTEPAKPRGFGERAASYLDIALGKQGTDDERG